MDPLVRHVCNNVGRFGSRCARSEKEACKKGDQFDQRSSGINPGGETSAFCLIVFMPEEAVQWKLAGVCMKHE